MIIEDKKTNNSENQNKKPPEPHGDLDDFIFENEEIKYHSER